MLRAFMIIFLWGICGVSSGQVVAKWTMGRIFDPLTPTIYLNAELNPYKNSTKKTLQASLGYGSWSNMTISGFTPTKSNTIRLGLEHRYYFREKFYQKYVSLSLETRNAFFNHEEWETICNTGDCFDQLLEKKSIRNAYSFIIRLGNMKSIGENIYMDYYWGLGIKYAKKTNNQDAVLDEIYFVKNDHYLFPVFSLGLRLGYMFKPKP
jgi:Protein of unknown function (DUF3575)